MIDVLTEHLIDARTAAGLDVFSNPRTGKPGHKSKVHRAMTHGCRGHDGRTVKLDHVRVPGGVRTSREAVGRFVAELTGEPNPAAVARRTPAQRDRGHARDVARLATVGIR
jgi:hypothetical protein